MAITPERRRLLGTKASRASGDVDGTAGYARWWKYSATATGLRPMVDKAFDVTDST